MRRCVATSVVAWGIAFSSTACAQADAQVDAEGVNEGAVIIVTARHREESLQDVPASVSVVSGSLLSASNTTDLENIAKFVPSLSFQNINPRGTNLNIRGLGNNIGVASDGLDPGVGVYIDEVYYNRPGTTAFDLMDIESIEVLSGPQGTLHGKNTTAGAIKVTTARPRFVPEVIAEVSAGNIGFMQAKAVVNVPLIDDRLAMRISGIVTSRDGITKNTVTRDDKNNINAQLIRGQLLFTPTDTLSLRLIGDYGYQNERCCALVISDIVSPANGKDFRALSALFGYDPVVDPFARSNDSNRPAVIKNESGGVSLQADLETSVGVLTSISAWRFWNYTPSNDIDQTPVDVFVRGDNADRQDQFSQELRLASFGGGPIEYVAGLYFFDETIDAKITAEFGDAAMAYLISPAFPSIIVDGVVTDVTNRYRTTSLAAFGQLTWNISDRLSLTGGLRYSYDNKRGSYEAEASGGVPLVGPLAPFQAFRDAFAPTASFSLQYKPKKLAGSANISYKLSEDVLLYANYARGNRSGGLNLVNLAPGISPIVKSETVDSFEIGFKSSLLDNRATINAAAYIQNDKNYQATVVDPSGRVTYLSNVPKVRGKGAELSVAARPSDNLSLYASAAYADVKYASFPAGQCPLEQSNLPSCDLSGLQLPGVPKWAFSLGGEARQDVSVFDQEAQAYLAIDFSYRTSMNTTPQLSKYTVVPDLSLMNARIGIRAQNKRIDAYLFAKNIFNKDYFSTLIAGAGNTGVIFGKVGDPRTYGLTVRFHY